MLTLVERIEPYAREQRWKCRCVCGNETNVLTAHLSRGHTKSCGCFKINGLIARSTRHGLRHHPINDIYFAMRARCQNPRNKQFKDYGARGINVCAEWQTFEGFACDMLPTYEANKRLSLERRDNDGNYCKSNCYWATLDQQNSNKRSTVWINTPEWGRLPVFIAARKLNIRAQTIHSRLRKGWTDEEALYGKQNKH